MQCTCNHSPFQQPIDYMKYPYLSARLWSVQSDNSCKTAIFSVLSAISHWRYHNLAMNHPYIDGIVQDSSNSFANALGLLQSCIKTPKYLPTNGRLVW